MLLRKGNSKLSGMMNSHPGIRGGHSNPCVYKGTEQLSWHQENSNSSTSIWNKEFPKVMRLLGGELSDKKQMSWKLQNFQALLLVASDLPISTDTWDENTGCVWLRKGCSLMFKYQGTFYVPWQKHFYLQNTSLVKIKDVEKESTNFPKGISRRNNEISSDAYPLFPNPCLLG